MDYHEMIIGMMTWHDCHNMDDYDDYGCDNDNADHYCDGHYIMVILRYIIIYYDILWY